MYNGTLRHGSAPFPGNAAGQVYNQTIQFGYLGRAVKADRNIKSVKITRSRGHERASGGIRRESITLRVGLSLIHI